MTTSTAQATQPAASAATFLRWAAALAAAYAATWMLTTALWWLLADVMGVAPQPLAMERVPAFAVGFAVFFMPILYVVPCALARQWLRPDPKTVAMYMGVAFLLGAGLEMVVDPVWTWVFSRPCWLYVIWPVHRGHTSGFGFIMWPMYGFFVGNLHLAIASSPRLAFLNGSWQRAALLAADAMALEVAANLFALAGFGSWLFRYHAPDLHHFTTYEVFPVYLLCGYVGVRVLHALQHRPNRAWYGLGAFVLAAGAVFLL